MASSAYDPVRYKQGSRDNWNLVASQYHSEWAGKGVGPFKSTAELVRAAKVCKESSVLDVACGTGAVSIEAARLSPRLLVGIDFARNALAIAKSSVPSRVGGSDGLPFFAAEMDAEHIGLRPGTFDRVLCQYALMFFPDPARVLAALKAVMKKGGGILAVAVHGSREEVPYFSTVMDSVLRHIPSIRPEGTPTVHRFGNPDDLDRVVRSAGFADVSVRGFTFHYSAGTFEEYWSDYMSSTAASIRSVIEGMGATIVSEIRSEAESKARDYMRKGTIEFPWRVLVATGHT